MVQYLVYVNSVDLKIELMFNCTIESKSRMHKWQVTVKNLWLRSASSSHANFEVKNFEITLLQYNKNFFILICQISQILFPVVLINP